MEEYTIEIHYPYLHIYNKQHQLHSPTINNTPIPAKQHLTKHHKEYYIAGTLTHPTPGQPSIQSTEATIYTNTRGEYHNPNKQTPAITLHPTPHTQNTIIQENWYNGKYQSTKTI